ncbi:MAG TPA: helix-turn-helix transcriptional regulator [Solirubrobacterales bacterium]|jgi:transcriptional regulator with XRE-family HTH domain
MATSPAEAFGIALREARLKRGLSQEEAASVGGIDRAYFGHVERATKTPTLSMIFRVAGAVGVKPSRLFLQAEQILSQKDHPKR